MSATFVKTRRPGDDLQDEALALRWLAAAEPQGGAHVARVVAVDEQRLVLERIAETPPSAAAARRFGRALAHTHASGAAWWGCPPPGWRGPAWVGHSRSPLILTAEDAPPTWGEFAAEYRVDAFSRRLRDSGTIDAAQAAVFDGLSLRLRRGDFDAAQPALVVEAGHEVARLHGDMWGGNVLYDDGPTGASLIDPYAQGGHAETDLATLAAFGFPHLDDVYTGYDAESPLTPGWPERIVLHQIGVIIMHAFKFGGGYVGAALRIAERYR